MGKFICVIFFRHAKLELNKEMMLRKLKIDTTNKDQTSLIFLTNIHEEIIKHFKNEELLDNSQIQIYLNVISKIKLQSDDHLNFAKNIKSSLHKIYNENEKSKTENMESSESSRNFQKWESTSSEKPLVVKMPYNSSSDNESFNSDMLSGNNFIQSSPSLKTITKYSVPSTDNDYKFAVISRDFKKYYQAAHLTDEMVTHAMEIPHNMNINTKEGKSNIIFIY